MHMHAIAIDLYTYDTDIMKPLYPLSRSVHCKKTKTTVIVHVQTLIQYQFQNNRILKTYTLSICTRIVIIYMY